VTTARRIRLALVVYGLLAIAALIWGLLRGAPDLYHHPSPWFDLPFPLGTGAALLAGVLVALAVIASTRVLVRKTKWARTLHAEFREVLGPLRSTEIAVFALSSGIAEEMLFRGAMQPALGLVLSSLLFGAVHMGPIRRFWPWTLWATVMGFVFAVLFAATGELLAPVVAHVLINYENMHFIEAFDPAPPEDSSESGSRSSETPRLVGTKLRTGGPRG